MIKRKGNGCNMKNKNWEKIITGMSVSLYLIILFMTTGKEMIVIGEVSVFGKNLYSHRTLLDYIRVVGYVLAPMVVFEVIDELGCRNKYFLFLRHIVSSASTSTMAICILLITPAMDNISVGLGILIILLGIFMLGYIAFLVATYIKKAYD